MLIYKKLWDLLESRSMKKNDLLEILSPTTIAKLGKNANVNTDTIAKLCDYLDCQPGDIVENVPDSVLEDTKQKLQEMNDLLKTLIDSNPGLKTQIGEQLDKNSEAYKNFQKGDYFGSSIISDALDKKDPAE